MKLIRMKSVVLALGLLALPSIAHAVPVIDCTNPPSTWTASSVTVKVTGLAVGQRCIVSVWDGPYLTCPVSAADVKGSARSNPADGSGNVTVTVPIPGNNAAAGDTVIVNTHDLCVGAVQLIAPNLLDCSLAACPVCQYGACCNEATNECFRATDLDCKDLGYKYRGDGTICGANGQCIPTLSEWGVVVLATLVLTAGTIVVMRRRAVVTN